MTAPAPSGGPSPLRLGGLALIGVGVIAAVIGVATVATGGGSDDPTVAAPPTASSETVPTSAPGTTDPGALPSFAPAPGTDGSSGTGDGAAGGGTGTAGSGPGSTGGDGSGTGGTGAGGTGPGGTGSGGTGSGGTGSGGTGTGGAGVQQGSAGAGGTGGAGGSGAVVAAPREPLRVYNNSTIAGLAAKAAEDFRRAGWTVTESRNYSDGVIPTTTVYYRPGTAEQAAAERLAAEFGMRAEPRFAGIQDATPGLIVILTKDYKYAASS
ncbi:LytR C-terminal domain-containing protein [Pseudonocardia sp.]|uniref:LytR C-terminal domain-containing protein n=1 Tax=Pseudonocardia sp. TaxID=60912 RepID=UPI0031FCA4F6